MKTKLAALMCVVVSMTGCMAVVQGNGKTREEAREVESFDSISVGHGFQAVATLGSPASVTVEADENIQQYVVATVSRGHLVIDAPDGTLLMASKPVLIKIVSPTLTGVHASGEAKVTAVASPGEQLGVDASGAAHIEVTGISAQRLIAQGSGLSRLTLSGTVREVSLDLSGASNAKTTGLSAETVRLDGSGASSGMVRASAAVTGDLSGASHFTIVGRPSLVNVDTSGGSKIELAD